MASLVPSDDRERPGVLLIAPPTSYRIAAYQAAARQLDVHLLLASEGVDSLVSTLMGGLHIDPNDFPGSIDRILRATRERPVKGVVASDDSCVELAATVARAIDLPHNSPASVRRTRRKDLARACLRDAGEPVPDFRVVEVGQCLKAPDHQVQFPCVVKPLALSGSRGVIRADDAQGLADACRRIQPLLRDLRDPFEQSHVLVEQFFPGIEVALEGMLISGELQILAIFDKPDPLDGPYFEETYYLTPSRLNPELQDKIGRCVHSACRAYGLREGPVHAELRVRKGKLCILEIAARTIGGQCARLLRIGSGYSLEELVLRHAIGRPIKPEQQDGGAGVLMIPITKAGVLRRVEGVLQARQVRFVEDVEISLREGQQLVPLPEGGSYLGFIFARGPGPAQAEAALREAHACLNVVTAPVWRIEGRGDEGLPN